MVAVAGLLAVQFLTRFLLADTGRIERENDPDCSPGPRFWLSGCVPGNVFGVRSDVAEDIAIEITALAVVEPPFAHPDNPPMHLDRYVDLLARDAPAPRRALGLICELPHHLQYESRARLIDDKSKQGRGLHEFSSAHGLPDGLAELGFSELFQPVASVVHCPRQWPSGIDFAAHLTEGVFRNADAARLAIPSSRAAILTPSPMMSSSTSTTPRCRTRSIHCRRWF